MQEALEKLDVQRPADQDEQPDRCDDNGSDGRNTLQCSFVHDHFDAGRLIVTVVPLPTSLCTVSLPPCASTNDLTTLTPRPRPWRPNSYCPEACLVTSKPVKNVSPKRLSDASSIPRPVSATLIWTPSPLRLAATLIDPPSGVNLTALSRRWLSASRIFTESIST